MALSAFSGSFDLNTTTGNQSVTGVGFQPKAILFFVNSLNASGSAAGMTGGVGFAVSSSARFSTATELTNGVSPASPNIRQDNTKCFIVTNNAGAAIIEVDFVSHNADGFTVNVATTDGAARKVLYLAIGGADLSNVALKEFTSKTSTGTQAITGVGFQPDSILFISNLNGTAAPNTRNGGFFCYGAANSTSTETVFNQNLGENGGSTQNQQMQLTDAVLSISNAGSTLWKAILSSFDADGFTLDWTTANGTARYIWGLCLKGGQFKTGSFNQATSTGNQSVTGVGSQPAGLFLRSWNRASSTSVITGNVTMSFGIGSSSSARSAMMWSTENAVATTDTSCNLDTTKIIKMMSANGTTPSTEAAADLVSLDSDGFTINNTTADATAREILFMTFGNTASSTAVKDIMGYGYIPFAR